MNEDDQGHSFLVCSTRQVEGEGEFSPTCVDKVLMDAESVDRRPGRELNRCGILVGVVLAHFRQVLRLQVFANPRRGLHMTFLRPDKEILFVSLKLDRRCLGARNRRRKAIGVRRILRSEMRRAGQNQSGEQQAN